MKSEESSQQTCLGALNQDSSNNFVQCSGKNQAFQFCLNEKCTQNHPFTCCTKKCPCHDQHVLCKGVNLQKCLEIIKSKIRNTDDIRQHIEKLMEKIIDELSQFRDNLIKQVETTMRYGMLHELEHKFLKISQNQIQPKQLTPKQASQLWKILIGKSQNKTNKFEELIQKLQNFESKIMQQILMTNKQIQQVIRPLRQKITKENQKPLPILKYQSSICTTEQLQERMVKMFPKKIKKFQLIYQASKYSFSLNKYKQLCGTEQNTIILALTQKDKIFGGFTPFCFHSGNNEWVTDSAKSSFLFSLSENAKFQLEDQGRAIYRYQDNGLIRFGSDFYIHDLANKNMCMIGFQSGYKNSRFSNCPYSYLKLNGSFSQNSSLKEWEVLKVYFEEEKI